MRAPAIFICLGSAVLELLLAGTSVAQQWPIDAVYTAKDKSVVPIGEQATTLSLDFPALQHRDGKRVCLRLKAYLDYPKPAGWNPYLAIAINGFNRQFTRIRQFESISGKNFDAVIGPRIVRGRNYHSRRKTARPRQICHSGRCNHARTVHDHAHCRHSRRYAIGNPAARLTCVLSNQRLRLPCRANQIVSERAPDQVRDVRDDGAVPSLGPKLLLERRVGGGDERLVGAVARVDRVAVCGARGLVGLRNCDVEPPLRDDAGRARRDVDEDERARRVVGVARLDPALAAGYPCTARKRSIRAVVASMSTPTISPPSMSPASRKRSSRSIAAP